MGRGGVREREKREKRQQERLITATGPQGNLSRKPRRLVINEREEVPITNERDSKVVTTVLSLSELKKKRQLEQTDSSSDLTLPVKPTRDVVTSNILTPETTVSSSPAPVRLRRIRIGEEAKPVPNDDSKVVTTVSRPSPTDSGLGSDSPSRRSSNSTSLDDVEQAPAVILAATSTQHLTVPAIGIQKSAESADLVIELDASDIEDSPALVKMSASPAVNSTVTSIAVHKSDIDTLIMVEQPSVPKAATPPPMPAANETSENLVVSRKRSAPSEWDTDSEGAPVMGRRRGRRGGRNRPKGDHYVPIEDRVDRYEPWPRRDDPNIPDRIPDYYKPGIKKNDRIDHYEPRPRKEPLCSQEEVFDKRLRKHPLPSQQEMVEKAGIDSRKREWERKKEREWGRENNKDRERRVSRGREGDERMELDKGSITLSGKETWEASSYVPQSSAMGPSIEDVPMRPMLAQRRGWGDSGESQSHSHSHAHPPPPPPPPPHLHPQNSHSHPYPLAAVHSLDTYRIGFDDERRRESDSIMLQVDKYLQKSLARMVVNVMDDLYDSRVISNRDAFKDMARTITESFMRDLRSLASLSSPRSPLESELGSNALVEVYTQSMLAKMIRNA